jgi:ABC-type nitrate/sulfonate/bicarbonate transport system substrate-binding protein
VRDPKNSARALARVVSERRKRGANPLTFGMTFPFSCHNYFLRFWIAAAGLDPDEDVQLVVLPPSYMVDSLSSHQVDGFCVGAPWNSVAVELGVGEILHFGRDIVGRMPEKVLAVRAAWASNRGEALTRLLRALGRAADFINDPARIGETAALLAAPNRIGVAADIVARMLKGRMRMTPGGPLHDIDDYILIGAAAARPDPDHAAWLYAQMVRWHQTALSAESLEAARSCYRPDLYDLALSKPADAAPLYGDRIGAFAGPPFDGKDIAGHIAALRFSNQNR